MKRKIIAIAILILLSILVVTGCSNINYGESFDTFDQLKAFLTQKGMEFEYPIDFDGENDIKYNYIAQYDNSLKAYSGYKLYRFSSPFYVTVYAFSDSSAEIMSDEPNRLTKVETVDSEKGVISIYRGDGRDNSLFIIGTIDIGANRYECRVTPDKSFTDGKLTNIITLENENFNKAIELVIKTLESIG